MTQRMYFLDNLKTYIVALMVVFHAAMSYMAYAPEWWYVVDGSQTLAGTIFVLWADVFIMPIMFFAAGYVTPPSLGRRGSRSFWRQKGLRIVLPWAFGSLFLAPYIAYLTLASRHSPMGFGEFYTTLFWGVFYQQAHYWFLGFLCLLYVLFWLGAQYCPDWLRPGEPSPVSWQVLGVITVGTGLAMAAINGVIADDAWIHPAYLLVFQPTRAPFYIAYFFLGAYAWRRQWFTMSAPAPSCRTWALACVVTSAAYVGFRLTASGILVHALLHSLCCLAAVMAGLTLFRRYGNSDAPYWRTTAALSYPVYYVHQFFVQHLVWLLRDTGWPLGGKYVAVCVLSLALSALVSRYVLKKLPCF